MLGPESGKPYPTLDMLTHWAAHGLPFIRQPLSWPAMQPTIGGAISTSEFANLSATLAMCKALGIAVLLDANHTTAYGAGQQKAFWGRPAVPVSALVDYWTKLTALLRADPSFSAVHGYEPINEPNNLDPNAAGLVSTAYSRNLCFSSTSKFSPRYAMQETPQPSM